MELPTALGIDTGTAKTGVALVRADDTILFTTVLLPKNAWPSQDRIVWLYDKLAGLVQQHQPTLIAIEIYTPPSIKVRALSPRAWAEQNWLIGACMPLIRIVPQTSLLELLEAKDWQHQLTGIHKSAPIGGKMVLRRTVELRTGYRFTTPCTEDEGGHDSDAAGIALVALDRWKQTQLINQAVHAARLPRR
jgi:hypothetical protein